MTVGKIFMTLLCTDIIIIRNSLSTDVYCVDSARQNLRSIFGYHIQKLLAGANTVHCSGQLANNLIWLRHSSTGNWFHASLNWELTYGVSFRSSPGSCFTNVFRTLQKISWKYTMPVITFMLRIQSWNSLCVCLNHGFGHTNKVSAWNFNRTCDFWITQIWREWFGELGNVNKTTSCYKRVAKEPKQHRNLSFNAMTCHFPRRISHLKKYLINITKHRIWHEYPCVPRKRHVHRIPVEMKPPGSGFILLLDIPNKCVLWHIFQMLLEPPHRVWK